MIEEQKARGQEDKQVTSLNSLAPCGRGQGEGSKSLRKTLSRICKFAYCSLTNSTLSQRERVRSKIAFTLAEVLITLGIIGVVAALTIPSLIGRYQERQIITHLSKTYSILSQAYQMMVFDYGTIDTWGTFSNTSTGKIDPETGLPIYDHSAQIFIAERLKKYLKVLKTCELNQVCNPYPRYDLSGKKKAEQLIIKPSSDSIPEGTFYLEDGTLITLGWYAGNKINISILLPVLKKRIYGKNVFYMSLTPQGLELEGFPGEVSNPFTYCDPRLESANIGRGCTAWVLINKNMDYLHCREKLGWDKASSCK